MKTAYVIGGAACVMEDFKNAPKPKKGDLIVVVNDIGIKWEGEIDAWVSLHGEKLIHWMDERKANGLPDAKETYTGLSAGDIPEVRRKIDHCVDPKFPGQTDGGSSGLFGAKVALEDMKADRVILCGVPLSPEGAHFADPARWGDADEHWVGWDQAMNHLRGKVTSMSGRTKEMLGLPEGATKDYTPKIFQHGAAKVVRTDWGWRHQCPGCNMTHLIPLGWSWNGNAEKPTFQLSPRQRLNGDDECAYKLEDGNLTYTNDSYHKLAGKTVPLPDLPKGQDRAVAEQQDTSTKGQGKTDQKTENPTAG
jgi:hypothetical protein